MGLTASQVGLMGFSPFLGTPLWSQVLLFPAYHVGCLAFFEMRATYGVSVVLGCASQAIFYAAVFDFAYVVARNAARRRQKRHGGAGGAGSLE